MTQQSIAIDIDPAAPSLGKRVLHASGWAFIQHGTGLALRLGSNLLLTRMLAPEAFGLMAVVQALMLGLALLSDVGIAQSLIVHRRGDDADFLNTAWTVQILRGWLIWLVAAGCAMAVLYLSHAGWFAAGTVYTDPQLPYIVVVFAIYAVIMGFETTKIQQARRGLRLKQIACIELSTQVLALFVTITLAILWRSVWALVAGALVAALVKVAAGHYFVSGHRNRITWDHGAWSDIFKFGKWIAVSSVIGFLVLSGDRILLGALVDSYFLGTYAIAVLLLGAVHTAFGAVIGSVLFPALSEVARDHRHDLKRVYTKFQSQADIALFTLSGVLFAAGPAIVELLYDHRYDAAGRILSVLAVGLIGSRYIVAEQSYLAMNRVQYQAMSNLCRATGLCIGVPVGYAMSGINGALAAIVLAQFAGWPLALYFEKKNGLLEWKRILIGIPLFVAGAALGWGADTGIRLSLGLFR
jgi:O-antigen/teichoic acid export membrane protein